MDIFFVFLHHFAIHVGDGTSGMMGGVYGYEDEYMYNWMSGEREKERKYVQSPTRECVINQRKESPSTKVRTS